MSKKHDFSGLVTAYGVPCSDGRVIEHGAFDHQDGQRVTMVWRHMHKELENVLGHGFLQATKAGMRVKAFFNNSKQGQLAKQLVHSGDLQFLSIWANQVIEHMDEVAGLKRVKKGQIREFSLVLSGANPGAVIDNVVMHSDDEWEPDVVLTDSLLIQTGEPIEIYHEEASEEVAKPVVEHEGETVKQIFETFTEEQKNLTYIMIHSAVSGTVDIESGSENNDGEGPTVKEVFDTLTEEQKNVLYYMVGAASEKETDVQQSDTGDNQMKHNVFENGGEEKEVTISHDEMNSILQQASKARSGKLSEFFESSFEHAGTYGIDNISYLFPDAKNVQQTPVWYAEDMDWVNAIMTGVRKSRFSRIKTRYADITTEEARALGYATGDLKVEEVFEILYRVTTPQTIYKKQKLDRDDILDITDFNVVQWMKAEMQVMLRAEVARAILVGDGRLVTDDYKISETNIRPIYTDDDMYAHKVLIASTDTVLDIIDAFVEQRNNYKGSGNPTLYATPELLNSMLLVRDTTGRRIYDTERSLAAALRVSNIVEVPKMSGHTRDDDGDTLTLLGILVNLNDYTIGMDRGGETTFFSDFDIDYNQEKYLLETRLSGSLTIPKAALVFEQTDAV
jgi:hypothetical protein